MASAMNNVRDYASRVLKLINKYRYPMKKPIHDCELQDQMTKVNASLKDDTHLVKVETLGELIDSIIPVDVYNVHTRLEMIDSIMESLKFQTYTELPSKAMILETVSAVMSYHSSVVMLRALSNVRAPRSWVLPSKGGLDDQNCDQQEEVIDIVDDGTDCINWIPIRAPKPRTELSASASAWVPPPSRQQKKRERKVAVSLIKANNR